MKTLIETRKPTFKIIYHHDRKLLTYLLSWKTWLIFEIV